MIACKTKDDYLLLKALRAHGWDRDIQKQRVNKKFNFINSGFNLRPLEVSAAIGLNQFKRLSKMMSIRTYNRNKLIILLKNQKIGINNLVFLPTKNLNQVGLVFRFYLMQNILKKEKFLNFLNKNRVETRPIISGNFVNQPAINLYNISYNLKKLQTLNKLIKEVFLLDCQPQSFQTRW